MIQIFSVFWEFFKIGLFAVGGGPATIPFLIDLCEQTKWFSMEELTNMIAISESTPGPIGLNMATYVGFTTLGTFGGLVSTIGLVVPSIIVIIIIAKFLKDFNDRPIVKHVFTGIRPAVTGLIASAVLNMCIVSLVYTTETETIIPAWKSIILCAVIFTLLQFKKTKKIHPALLIIGSGVLGVLLQM